VLLISSSDDNASKSLLDVGQTLNGFVRNALDHRLVEPPSSSSPLSGETLNGVTNGRTGARLAKSQPDEFRRRAKEQTPLLKV
jgi:hypothetical protein